MDFFEKSGVNVLSSVIVSGVTHTAKDDELFDVLKQYGRFKKIIVDDEHCPFYKNLVVEFKSQSAVIELAKVLPYTHISESDPEIKFCVTLPPSKSTVQAGAESPFPDYMNELRHLARRSGQKLENVLQDVLCQINEHLNTVEVEPNGGLKDEGNPSELSADQATLSPGQQGGATAQLPSQPVLSQPGSEHPRHTASLQGNEGAGAGRVSVANSDLNPPEVQRVVVEHVVRSEELTTHSLPKLRLRPFSGKVPKPANELDYDTWKSHIELLLADVHLPPVQITRRIVESLLSPAADFVKGLKPDTLPSVYLQILDSAYSTVQDGDELFAQFLNTLQDPGEKASSYLQRLLLALNTAVKRGGIAAAETNKHLLRQFCRGCWDNGLISKLQLDQKKEKPPAFPELLLLLRTEEDRQLAKESLMKKHIGSSKHRAALQAQTCSHTNADTSSINELKQQVMKLQQQMSALLAQTTRTSAKTTSRTNHTPKSPSGRMQNTRPRAGFCFRCGEDSHIVASCNQSENPALVRQKRLRLQQRQEQWDSMNNNLKSSN